jgi:hypothetical protein
MGISNLDRENAKEHGHTHDSQAWKTEKEKHLTK